MTQLFIVADVAGRIAKRLGAHPLATCAAVALDPADADVIRPLLSQLPKWAQCSYSDVQTVVGLLTTHSLAMAGYTLDRSNEVWAQFWDDARSVCDIITRQDRKSVGFAKPATISRLVLFGDAMIAATSHAMNRAKRTSILDGRGLELIERTLVVDTDFAGQETLDFLRDIWVNELPQPKTNSIGFRVITKDLHIKTEENEPLLLLADYLAGLVHCMGVGNYSGISFPITRAEAEEQMERIAETGKLVFRREAFNLDCKEIFNKLFEASGAGSN